MMSNIKEFQPKAEVRNLDFYYAGTNKPALRSINLTIPERQVTSLIGPSGCGKTTLLRCFNRMHDLYAANRYEGGIYIDTVNILDHKVDH